MANHYQNGVARAQQEIANKMCGRVENGPRMVAFPGDNNPKSGVWFVGAGFGKSSTGVRYRSQAEAQAAADKLNREADRAAEHDEWREKQRERIASGEVRRAVMSRR